MSRTAHNLVYLLASQVATWAVTLLVLIVAPRYLGPDGFGEIGFAAAYMQFFTLAATLGTAVYLTRKVARDNSILGHYVFNSVALAVAACAILSVLAVLIAMAIGTGGSKLVLVVLGCFTMLFAVVNGLFVAALAGLERMGRPAMWNTLQTVVASVGSILILYAGGGVIAYSVVLCLSGLIPLIANSRVVWPWTSGSRSIDFGVWWTLVRGGLPLMVLSALIVLYGTIDIPILSRLSDDPTVGWYTLAFRFVGIPVFIAQATMTAFFPSISAHGETISDEFVRLVNRSLRVVVLVSVPMSAGIAVLSHRIIDLLYDDRYDNAVSIMQILALGIPLTTVGVALATALIASDRQNGYVLFAALAAVLNPVACLVAIPWTMDRYDNGAIGAAIVTVGTELFMFGGALLLRSQGVMDKTTTWFCLRAVFAAGVMVAVMASFGELPLAPLCVLGVVGYLAVSILVRTIAVDDVRGAVGMFTGAVRSTRRSTT